MGALGKVPGSCLRWWKVKAGGFKDRMLWDSGEETVPRVGQQCWEIPLVTYPMRERVESRGRGHCSPPVFLRRLSQGLPSVSSQPWELSGI